MFLKRQPLDVIRPQLSDFENVDFSTVELPKEFKPTQSWSIEAVQRLVYYDKLGLSMSEMARLLNQDSQVERKGYTRNSVIGKRRRLGLEERTYSASRIPKRNRNVGFGNNTPSSQGVGTRLDDPDFVYSRELDFYGRRLLEGLTIDVGGKRVLDDGVMVYGEDGSINFNAYMPLFECLQYEIGNVRGIINDYGGDGLSTKKDPFSGLKRAVRSLDEVLRTELTVSPRFACPLGALTVLARDYSIIAKELDGISKTKGLLGIDSITHEVAEGLRSENLPEKGIYWVRPSSFKSYDRAA